MGLLDIVLQSWKGEKPDQNLEVFFNSIGFSRVPFNKEYKGAQLTKPSIVDIPAPGDYRIFFGPEDSPLWVKLHFNKKGPHIIDPVIVRKEHVEEIFGIPNTSIEEYRSLRILRLGSKRSYEHARDLAALLERFEEAALFRDKIKNAPEDEAPVQNPRREEAKKPWLPKKLLLPTLAGMGLTLAAIGALAGKLYFDSKDNSKKLDQVLDRIPRKDYVSNMSPTEIMYAKQFGLASELDILLKAEIAQNPKITDAEAGVLYLQPVHDQKQGIYNWHINAKEVQLNVTINEHTGEIDAPKDLEKKLKEFGLEDMYTRMKSRVWSNTNQVIAAEIRKEKIDRAEAKPWEERLSKEYGMPVKVRLHHIPVWDGNGSQPSGSSSFEMQIGNITLDYSVTKLYKKVGEAPVTKSPMYVPDEKEQPMVSFYGKIKLDDKHNAVFAQDYLRGVELLGGYGIGRFYEDHDHGKSDEHRELLSKGRKAYNDFRECFDMKKFLKVAEEWAKK